MELGNTNQSKQRGLTFVEVMVIVAVVTLVVLVVLPMIPHSHRSPRIACVHNQKQIGLAFRIWTFDHDERLPTEVSESEGGVKEAMARG
jgi:competence protein ComGC